MTIPDSPLKAESAMVICYGQERVFRIDFSAWGQVRGGEKTESQ